MLQKLIDVWRERRKHREWPVERHLEELRVLVQMDHRWLAHDPVANALTSRYLKALNEGWYKVSTEDVRNLRERLGLCPHQRASGAAAAPQPPGAQEGKPLDRIAMLTKIDAVLCKEKNHLQAEDEICAMAAQERKPLTVGQILSMDIRGTRDEALRFARAIEAAHGITHPTGD